MEVPSQHDAEKCISGFRNVVAKGKLNSGLKAGSKQWGMCGLSLKVCLDLGVPNSWPHCTDSNSSIDPPRDCVRAH